MSGQPRTLVGRERELAALTGVLSRARDGGGAVCLVTGEPGIGKTSLLEHTAEQAAELGFEVTWGRAWEVGGAPAHWIWIEALRALVSRPGADDDAAARVKSLVLDGAEHASDPFQLCDAVAQFVRSVATRSPLLIVLDDLHSTDVASLQIALFVARQLSGSPVAIVGSYRDVEARMSPGVEDALAKLARMGEVLSVGRLDRAAVGELVRDAVGSPDADVAKMVMDATEGNPLFVRELLRLIQARAGAPGVPSGVRAVIRERLALLSPATVALLQAAAVVGRDFEIGLAAAVAGVTPEAMEEAIAEATGAALVDTELPGRMRFSHALVAETLAADLSAPVRARLHRQAAETLETRHGDDPAAPVAEIAHHWLQAGSASAGRAVDAAERAAAAAADRLAFADAATLLDRATAALAIAAPADTRRRVELMLAHCEALARAGQRAEAEAMCREAAELARTLDDGVLFARVALALGAELIVGHADPEVKRLLDEALGRLPPGDSEWRARVMARLAGARQPESDPFVPIAQAREAIEMARRLGDDDVLLYALFAGMAAFTDYAPPKERLPLNRETAALAAARGEGPYEVRARSRILFDCVELMDAAMFETELAELDALVQRLGVPRYRWVPLAFRAMRADWRGEFADSDRFYREAREIAGPNEGPFRFTAREVMRMLLADREVDLDRERGLADASINNPALRSLLGALLDARAGRFDAARAGLRAVASPAVMDMVLSAHNVHGAQVIGYIAWFLDDPELARRPYELARNILGRGIALTGMGYLLDCTTDHLCMRLAIVMQQWDDMERHAAAALGMCERLGARSLAAHVYADWAAGVAKRGGDPARAAELARQGAVIADELGMTRVSERCRAVLDGAPARADVAQPLTLELEGEYWTVRGLGEVCRMRDSRGMQMLSTLLARPGEEVHVLELSGAGAADGGDAGPLLDAEARAAYEQRARDLRAELDEAEANNDPGRRERAQGELEALTAELSRAFGLGGRERRAGSAVERARSNVRRRIADAMNKLADAAPAIGEHLHAAVRTGVYCAYAPATSAEPARS